MIANVTEIHRQSRLNISMLITQHPIFYYFTHHRVPLWASAFHIVCLLTLLSCSQGDIYKDKRNFTTSVHQTTKQYAYSPTTRISSQLAQRADTYYRTQQLTRVVSGTNTRVKIYINFLSKINYNITKIQAILMIILKMFLH